MWLDIFLHTHLASFLLFFKVFFIFFALSLILAVFLCSKTCPNSLWSHLFVCLPVSQCCHYFCSHFYYCLDVSLFFCLSCNFSFISCLKCSTVLLSSSFPKSHLFRCLPLVLIFFLLHFCNNQYTVAVSISTSEATYIFLLYFYRYMIYLIYLISCLVISWFSYVYFCDQMMYLQCSYYFLKPFPICIAGNTPFASC